MDLPKIDNRIFKKGAFAGNNNAFENLIQLTEHLFETPIISICSVENDKLDYNYLKGLTYSKLPDFNPFFDLLSVQKEILCISDFKNSRNYGITNLSTPYSEYQFYCGAALIDKAGIVIGFFEIADIHSRAFSEKQLKQFQLIANQISDLLIGGYIVKSTKKELAGYKENEYQKNLLLQGLDDGWWDKDFEKNETFYSPKWWQMLGRVPDPTQKKHDFWKSLMHPDDIVRFEKYFSSVKPKNEQWFSMEFKMLHADGHYVPILTRGFYIQNEAGKISRIIGSNFDLTHQKKVEEAAKESQENLLAIFNHAPTAMFIARPSDGLIIMVNKELQKLAESSEIELLGKYTTDFYVNETDRILFFSVLKENGSVKNLEIDIKKPNGTIAHCLVSSELIIYKSETMLLSGFIDISDRKKSEELLIQKEESFRSLYNRTPVMIHSINEHGDFLTVSDYWLAKLGYQRTQVIGKNISQFFTKASVRNALKFRLPELNKRGYDFDIPYQGIKRNGEVMDVLVSTIIEKSHEEKEKRYLSVIQDVTERKKIDEALQQSEDNLRTIFENTNIGYALLDADMFIVSFNQAMQKFANNDLHKTLYLHTFSILYFSENRQAALIQAMGVVLKGQTINYEINYIQPNGKDRWYKMNMFPVLNKDTIAVGIVMAIEDINESKIKEIHLNKVVKEISDYKLALDESSIVLISNAQGLITYANENCLAITQYSFDELINKDLSFLESGYHTERFFSEMWDTIKTGAIWKGEIRNKNKSDQYFWVDCTIVPFIDKSGIPYQYIAIQRDITLTKNAEIELNKSFSLVNEQNKRLLNFSYIVSHNLRSHTSNIISILNFLEKEDSPTEKDELMMHLKRVSRSLNDTLFNLNEVVSIRNNINLVIEPLNLLEYILQALRVMEEQITLKKVVVSNNVEKSFVVNYNPAYLESILLNFLSNAIKYASPDRRPQISLSIFNENGELGLLISDNGIGIDMKKNADKLFGMYKTFNNNADARGIGLFITKNQIDAMGGRVEVESVLGVGSIFKIFFKQ